MFLETLGENAQECRKITVPINRTDTEKSLMVFDAINNKILMLI
jgi:hypothetical protein